MNKALIFLYACIPNMAFAAEVSSSSHAVNGDYMTKLLLSLGLVVAIIFALAWLVKRFNFIPQQSQNLIKIMSTLSVGSRDRLALIQVGDEQLLIALTPGKISKLHCLKNPVKTVDEAQSSFKNKMDFLLDKQNLDKKKNKMPSVDDE